MAIFTTVLTVQTTPFRDAANPIRRCRAGQSLGSLLRFQRDSKISVHTKFPQRSPETGH
jgi:hypothetical protein